MAIKSRFVKKCATCGKLVYLHFNDVKEYNYCSRECSYSSDRNKNTAKNIGLKNKGMKRSKEHIEKMTHRGKDNPSWKGGVTYRKRKGNYANYKIKYVKCPIEFISMSRKDGYVMEHRLLIAQKLNRPLIRSEVVHHIDHNPENNSIDNLMLFSSNKEHKIYEGIHS
jgi:hypothetical protein